MTKAELITAIRESGLPVAVIDTLVVMADARSALVIPSQAGVFNSVVRITDQAGVTRHERISDVTAGLIADSEFVVEQVSTEENPFTAYTLVSVDGDEPGDEE